VVRGRENRRDKGPTGAFTGIRNSAVDGGADDVRTARNRDILPAHSTFAFGTRVNHRVVRAFVCFRFRRLVVRTARFPNTPRRPGRTTRAIAGSAAAPRCSLNSRRRYLSRA